MTAQQWFNVGFVAWMLLPLIWWGSELTWMALNGWHYDSGQACFVPPARVKP